MAPHLYGKSLLEIRRGTNAKAMHLSLKALKLKFITTLLPQQFMGGVIVLVM